MARDTILINTMYTGDYTNKNIGHEIINAYKPDNSDDYYLYISPYGYLSSTWNNKIKTILYTRSAGKNKLEIIAKANVNQDGAQQISESRSALSLPGDKKFAALKAEWKELVIDIDNEYIEFMNALKKWEKNQKEKIRNNKDIDTDELMKSWDEEVVNKASNSGTSSYTENNEYTNWKEGKENEIISKIVDWEEAYKEWKQSYFNRLKEQSEKHLEQLKEIFKDPGIKYNGVYLCDIFNGNAGNEHAIYFGCKTKDIKKPSIPVYIKYGKETDENGEENDNSNNDELITEDNNEDKAKYKKKYKAKYVKKEITETEITYCFENAKMRNQSCYFYLNPERTKDYKEFEKAFNDDDKIFNVEIKCLNPDDKTEEETLINIMGKQNDELSYSNMLAYYINDKEIFKRFAKNVLEYEPEINTSNTFEIRREYNDIDLLINTDDDVFVIENKIKSGINGEKYDPYNGVYSNQLIKYYKTVKKDKDFKGKETHFYIFKPNYNKIEKLEEVEIKKIDETSGKTIKENLDDKTKEIIKEWEKGTINYSQLWEFFSDNANQEVLIEKKFVDQFVKALKIHTVDKENIIEKEMEYKFRQAIKQAKK